MTASEIRASARKSLTGKWGKAALLTLAYAIITFGINFVANLIPIVGSLIVLVISTPISYGLIVTFMKLKRDEEVSYTDFLSHGFSAFGKVWGVVGNIILKMILPVCLVIISIVLLMIGTGGAVFGTVLSSSSSAAAGAVAGFGILLVIGIILYVVSVIYAIIKGFLYSLSFYILNDNLDMSSKEIVNKSEELMTGNRWRYFWLSLTFIGWSILSVFTFGIGMLWLMPYIMVAMICFYEHLSGKLDTNTTVNTEE